jgi:hypothetical protein
MHPDITFAKIDVDENPEAATFSSIASIPTFQFRSGANKLKEVNLRFSILVDLYAPFFLQVFLFIIFYVKFAGADEAGLLNAVKELQNHK